MDLEEIKYRMQNQKLYCCDDERLIEEQLKRLDMVHDYNNPHLFNLYSEFLYIFICKSIYYYRI